ncbi:hypothetical protein B7463_g3617, partial [Scytalidium lignicola]
MRFSSVAVLFSLTAAVLAAPIERSTCSDAAAASSSSAVAASSTTTASVSKAASGVLTEKTYNEFSVSGGVAGNALAEVNAEFPIDLNNLADVAASDLAIIVKAAQVSEDAETETGGFNDAIDAAGGTKTTAGEALQNGKIKNKVLKLQTDILRLQIEQAQGKSGLDSQIASQQTKLDSNVSLDKAAAGEASTAIDFAGSD